LNIRNQDGLKVIFVASSYPRNPQDSAAVFLRYLAEHLQKLDLHIYILTPADNHADAVHEHGITVHRFRYFPKRWQKLAYGSGILANLKRNPLLWIQVPFFICAMTYSLLRLVKKLQPDIVHAHWVIPQGIAVIPAKLIFGTTVIITAHGSDAFALQNRLLSWVKRFLLRHCDAWTANTRATSEAVIMGQKLAIPHIIPMGVDIKLFESGARNRLRSGIKDEEKIILFVGRLVPSKGVDDLIRAFALLPSELRYRAKLWIVGTGKQENTLRMLASQLGAINQTRFWGNVPHSQLPDFYAAADLFVGPSLVTASGESEGQGIVFLEAFAARLCVVATDIGGIKEVVEDGKTGMLVKPRSPEALAKKMSLLLHDSVLRTKLISGAYKKAVQYYDWEQIARKFVDLYTQTCPNK
jgi:teichuronic acid biosynthesis glycosyltransferase TuaC